jgi:hypothetical protein
VVGAVVGAVVPETVSGIRRGVVPGEATIRESAARSSCRIAEATIASSRPTPRMIPPRTYQREARERAPGVSCWGFDSAMWMDVLCEKPVCCGERTG